VASIQKVMKLRELTAQTLSIEQQTRNTTLLGNFIIQVTEKTEYDSDLQYYCQRQFHAQYQHDHSNQQL